MVAVLAQDAEPQKVFVGIIFPQGQLYIPSGEGGIHILDAQGMVGVQTGRQVIGRAKGHAGNRQGLRQGAKGACPKARAGQLANGQSLRLGGCQ